MRKNILFNQAILAAGCMIFFITAGRAQSSGCNPLQPYDQIQSGFHTTIASRPDGTFLIWGAGSTANGNGAAAARHLTPVVIEPNPGIPAQDYNYTGAPLFATLATQSNTTTQAFVLSTDGLYSWGANNVAVGTGLDNLTGFAQISLPVGIVPTDIKNMIASWGALVLLTHTGEVYVSGRNDAIHGNGGVLPGASENYWARVTRDITGNPALTGVVDIRLTPVGAFAITSTGQWYTWGIRCYRGDGSAVATYNRAVAMTTPFPGLPVMIAMTADFGNNTWNDASNRASYFAINPADNKLYALGSNGNGQLGQGNTTNSSGWVPVRNSTNTADLDNVIFVSANDNDGSPGTPNASVSVILSNGELWSWGSNNNEMIGVPGGTGNHTLPKVPNGFAQGTDHATYVEIGGHTTAIMKLCAERYCYMGHKIDGSMGDGVSGTSTVSTFDCANTPVGLICGSSTYDAGDTPLSFENGNPAAHYYMCGDEIYLGASQPDPDNGLSNNVASGANNTGTNGDGADEDGLVTPLSHSTLNPNFSTTLSFTNNSGTNANIYAWIDWNNDGIFSQDEIVTASVPSVVGAQTTNLAWNGISTSCGNKYARVRITTETLSDDPATSTIDERSFGPVIHGEVEDFYVDVDILTDLAGDCDGDGVTNGQEVTDGTDPLNPCDLQLASITLTQSGSWLNGDCDGDGVTNGDEAGDGTDPNDPCEFVLASQSVIPDVAWNSTDCDGDGVTNSTEVTDGTNPLNPCEYNATHITLPVTVTNCPPVANGNTATTNEDTPVVINVPANDTDSDGNLDNTSVTVTDAPSNGTTSVDPVTGEITYTPNPNFHGTDTLIYSICDTGMPVFCDTALVIITVTPVNDGPTANGDMASTNEDTPVVIDVPSNDTDPDGNLDNTSVIVVTPPTNGTVTVDPVTGEITYTPDPEYSGNDTLIYSICDTGMPVLCDTALVVITVNPVNDAPIANGDTSTTDEDTPVVINTPSNDTDPDGNLDNTSVTVITPPTNGTVTIDPVTGEITYTPDPNFNGTDTLIYSICDTGIPVLCDTALAIITVNPVNDDPNANDDTATTNEDTPVVIDVPSNDTDPDGNLDETSVTVVTPPSNGTVTIDPATGEITYTPDPGFSGNDTLIYSICDTGMPVLCDTAVVVITITPVNDAPTANTDNTSTNEGDPVVVDTPSNDTDPDGNLDETSVTVVTPPSNGTVTIDPATGEITYTPDPGFSGNDTLIYSICDTGMPVLCDTAQVIITVIPCLSNPSNDCDGDGVTNGTEVTDGTDPNDPCDFTLASQTLTPNTAWNNADCDGDGVPNGAEVTDGDNPLDPCDFTLTSQTLTPNTAWNNADCDGDGVTNGDEVTDGTDPANPCDFTLASQTETPNTAWNNADCDGDGVTNGDEVTDGTDPNNPCDFTLASQTGTPGTAWNNADCDGDGVTNGTEVTDGTDPNDPCDFTLASQTLTPNTAWNNADCDGDGVPNGTEVTDGDNPLDPCDFTLANQTGTPNSAWNNADCDGDGVTNGDEVTDGTDPANPCDYIASSQTVTPVATWNTADCDGDGVTNGQEAADGTNPNDPCDYTMSNVTGTQGGAWNDADCDGDGVTNGTETTDGTNPNNPCDLVVSSQTGTPATAWNNADCDGDGMTNGEEVTSGSDPLDPCDPKTCGIDISNAFTPDGDGINDVWVIKGIEGYPDNQLTVFNRWGNQVFSADGYLNTWDGTSNSNLNVGGTELPTGTYFYVLDTKDETAGVLKGYVYIQR